MSSQLAFPKSLLFATDLSGRCDRAFDRAALLAKAWDANLSIVHALEKKPAISADRGGDLSWRDHQYAVAMRQIQEDMEDTQVSAKLILEEGVASDVVIRAAEEFGSDLVITGIARDKTPEQIILGDTLDRLIRSGAAPILTVKSRARRAYTNIVVAVDFSDASRIALLKAVALFPDAKIVLLHCYQALASGFIEPDTAKAVGRDVADGQHQQFLKSLDLPPNVVSSMPMLMERGDLGNVVQDYAMDNSLDLLVVGSQGRNVIARFILGSSAELLVATAPCDVLVISGATES